MSTAFAVGDVFVVEPGDDAARSIKIDPEFRSLVPAISDDERKQLEANIVEHGGARDPLTVWLRGDDDEVLLDGHNRYEICTRLRLPFSYRHVEFDTRDESADWIDRNQLGRRNLSKQDYKLLIGRIYNRAKKSQGAQEGNENASENKVEKVATLKTAERLAKEHGVSEKTVRNAGKFQQAVETLGITGDIVRGTVHASEAEIVAAANALPANPTKEQREAARRQVKERRRPARKPKGKAKTKPAPARAGADDAQVDHERAAMKALVAKQWDRVKKQFAVSELPMVRRLMLEIVKDERTEMKD